MAKRGTVLRFASDDPFFFVLCTLFRFTWLQSNTVQAMAEIVSVALRFVSFRFVSVSGYIHYSVLSSLPGSQSRCDAKDVCMQKQLDEDDPSLANQKIQVSAAGQL